MISIVSIKKKKKGFRNDWFNFQKLFIYLFLNWAALPSWWSSGFGWKLRGQTASIGVRPCRDIRLHRPRSITFSTQDDVTACPGHGKSISWLPLRPREKTPAAIYLWHSPVLPLRPTMHLENDPTRPDKPVQSFHLCASGGLHPFVCEQWTVISKQADCRAELS